MMDDLLTKSLGRMFRVALRLIGDRHRAEEAVQNACLRALRHNGKFEGRSQRTTWLHRITVNCCLDLLRRHGREVSRSLGFDEQLFGQPQYLNSNPAELAEQRELQTMAAAVIDELPEDCCTAFVLTQLDGYSYDDAAEIEGVARGTIASRVFRARKLLAEAMAERTGATNGVDQ